jgi:cell division protein FtsZ
MMKKGNVMNFEMLNEKAEGTVIKVIGVGGAGGNAVQHMISRGVSGVEFICANTDAQALNKSTVLHKIQLGESGLGAGAKPEVGRAAAQENRERIADLLRDANMVFITAGMGGGTGTGAAPIIAEVAKEMGILTVAVVSKPFEFEGSRRMRVAEEGLSELEKNVDSLIVVLNDKLEETLGDDVSMDEAFIAADNVLNNAVAGIAEIINVDGHINVDFNDVKTVMGEQGRAMMGTASASGHDRANVAATKAVASPLLDGVNLAGARGILINISATKATLKARETREVVSVIRDCASEDATVIYGFVYDETLGDDMRVTVVATGLGSHNTIGGGNGGGIGLQNPQTSGIRAASAPTDAQMFDGKPVATATAYRDHNYEAYAQAVNAPPVVDYNRGSIKTNPDAYDELDVPSFRRGTVQNFSNYDELDEPTINRRATQQATTRVVNGEDLSDLDVPAFLRRQAD